MVGIFAPYLVNGGLPGVQLVISDTCRGLAESVRIYLREALPTPHGIFLPHVFNHVPSTGVREVSHTLKGHSCARRAARPPTRRPRPSSKIRVGRPGDADLLRVVGAFPVRQSCLSVAAARLRYIAGTTWPAKCYMNTRPLYQQCLLETDAVA
ncbi:hypothetical protein ACVWZV_004483 [Bradyrhizobium sp. GM5.1]